MFLFLLDNGRRNLRLTPDSNEAALRHACERISCGQLAYY